MQQTGSVTPCLSCHSKIYSRTFGDTLCPTCGWDEKIGRRTCLKCQGPVILDPGEGFSAGTIGFAVVVEIPIFIFFGLIGVLATACVFAAIGGLISALTIRYVCGMCTEKASWSALSSGEQGELIKKRTIFFLGAAGFGVLAFILIGIWIALAVAVGAM